MSLEVESDAALAFEVGPAAGEVPLAGVAGAGSQSAPYRLPASPYDVLLATGRATAAIFSPTRALFNVSSHWAVIRWFWALDWSSPDLALSREAEFIRKHHRTAFSEALGLAGALLLAEHIAGDALPPGLWRGAGPLLLDVDSLATSGTRPDLVILYGGPARETFVIGAAAPGPDLGLHAISVPRGSTKAPDRLLTAARERAVELEVARLTSFAGLEGPEREVPPLPIPELGLEVIGQRMTLRGESFDAKITMGVDHEIVRNLGQVGSLEELAELRARVNSGRQGRIPAEEVSYPLTETGRAATYALDGCALSISLA